MQPKTAAPRDGLTAAQVVTLIERTDLTIDIGAELYDADEAYLDDISEDLVPAGHIESRSYATVHRSCRLRLSRELQWGGQRIRPYMTLSGGGVEVRFNLGMFLLSTPDTQAGETPKTWEVDGADKLTVLDVPHGQTHRIASGTGVITAVEALISGAGETAVQIDQTSAATLPADRLWPLDERTTTLQIINELLASIGYRGLWCDWDGSYRSEPYDAPSSLPSEWIYDAQDSTTTVGVDRTVGLDLRDTPNRWVFYRDDPTQDLPATNDGLYVVTNQSDGPASIDARGYTRSRVIRLDAADQTSLETQGDRIVEADKRLTARIGLAAGPNPLHWHMDVATVIDDELGISGRALLSDWTLPLDGSDMTLAGRLL